ncbi:PP2C family serine/threonine-protein phosphatase [Janthinobacterium sp.]|uniref:PP2C family protein-serine/threonine phosphatase n=1 Tax=Janthinobacterium sp. TaxID=1871054 RepID=UPI00293D7B95|nr:PP2C family serine/threonine-protein phosphatase [Janthinobacterium sp.]
MQFSVYQESHIGGRKLNQDRMGYCFTRDALLLLLADGMGGHPHGEIAAQISLQVIAQRFQQQAAPYVKGVERFLEESLLAAHHEIQRHRVAHQLSETPRTTVVACLIQHNTATWAHCGDSRLYWLRDGRILARTRDHSHIESLIAKGLAAPAERATHPDRNKLYNCLGASTAPKIELSGRVALLPGDQMLLCSDGLWSMLDDAELAARMRAATVVRAVPEMVGAALAAGGAHGDNVTALAIMWQGSAPVDGANSVAFDDAGRISTEALPPDLVGSTIQGLPGPAEREADVFDDDDIEKAIAEIRGAIEKSSQILK